MHLQAAAAAAHHSHANSIPANAFPRRLAGLNLAARPPICCITATAAARKQPHPLFGEDDPRALAFLGDAIWTLHVRAHFLQPPKHPRLYQSAVKPYVTAEGQAQVYDRLTTSSRSVTSLLQPDEVSFLRAVRSWGQDVKLRQRFSNSAAAGEMYRKATALEALVGHLHLHQPQRLAALMDALLPPALPPQALPQAPLPPPPPPPAAADVQGAGATVDELEQEAAAEGLFGS